MFHAFMQTPSPFAGLLDGFAWMIGRLRTQVAERGVGRAPLPAGLVVVAYGWLGRSLARLAVLVARFEAGEFGAGKFGGGKFGGGKSRAGAAPERASGAEGGGSEGASGSAPRREPRLGYGRLPQGDGWLLPLVPMHAATAGSQLTHMLAQPEMAALIAGVPTLGRVLRPLARMLGVVLPAELRLPARDVVRAKAVVAVRSGAAPGVGGGRSVVGRARAVGMGVGMRVGRRGGFGPG